MLQRASCPGMVTSPRNFLATNQNGFGTSSARARLGVSRPSTRSSGEALDGGVMGGMLALLRVGGRGKCRRARSVFPVLRVSYPERRSHRGEAFLHREVDSRPPTVGTDPRSQDRGP